MRSIYFISGPCGVGKSTLADAFAKHLANLGIRKQVYVIHGDDLLLFTDVMEKKAEGDNE